MQEYGTNLKLNGRLSLEELSLVSLEDASPGSVARGCGRSRRKGREGLLRLAEMGCFEDGGGRAEGAARGRRLDGRPDGD